SGTTSSRTHQNDGMSNRLNAAFIKRTCVRLDPADSELFVGAACFAAELQYVMKTTQRTSDASTGQRGSPRQTINATIAARIASNATIAAEPTSLRLPNCTTVVRGA